MPFEPAYLILRFLHRYIVRTRSSREDFRDPGLLGGREAPRIEFTSVASGTRYEIVARPVADATPDRSGDGPRLAPEMQ